MIPKTCPQCGRGAGEELPFCPRCNLNFDEVIKDLPEEYQRLFYPSEAEVLMTNLLLDKIMKDFNKMMGV